MRDLSFGARLEIADAAAAAAIAESLQLVVFSGLGDDKRLRSGYGGEYVVAVSARTGHLYRGYAPYGRIMGWTRLIAADSPVSRAEAGLSQ